MASAQILTHPRIASFDKDKVLAAVLRYRELSLKTAGDPAAFQGVPEEQRGDFKTFVRNMFGIRVAQAYLNAGDEAKTAAALTPTSRTAALPMPSIGIPGAPPWPCWASSPKPTTLSYPRPRRITRTPPSRPRPSTPRSTARRTASKPPSKPSLNSLPYHPEPFKPAADWKGKVVLAEIFTGSECPPASRPTSALTASSRLIPPNIWPSSNITCPIPDPIHDERVHPAAPGILRRQTARRRSSSTAIKKIVGGGGRGSSESKFKQYKSEIDARLDQHHVRSRRRRRPRRRRSWRRRARPNDRATPSTE